MRRFILIAVAAGLLAPQAAQAATLAPLNACYRSVDAATRESVTVVAGGFTPGEKVDVRIDDQVEADDVVVLPSGEVRGQVLAPYQARGERAFTLTVVSTDKPANFVSTVSRVSALALRLKPAKAKPSKRVRFIGRGFIDRDSANPLAPPIVHAHYVRGGKVRKTVSLGPAQGPCGTVDVKRRQIPIKKPKTGRWTLQVDNQAAYSNQPASVFVRLSIVVRRVLRGG